MDTERINAFWGTPGTTGFDTTSGAVHFPILEEKLGPDMPLHIDLAFSNFSVGLGHDNADISMNYTAQFNLSVYPEVNEANNSSEPQLFADTPELVLQDEIQLTTSAKVAMDDDILYVQISENKLNPDGAYSRNSEPINDQIGLDESEY